MVNPSNAHIQITVIRKSIIIAAYVHLAIGELVQYNYLHLYLISVLVVSLKNDRAGNCIRQLTNQSEL